MFGKAEPSGLLHTVKKRSSQKWRYFIQGSILLPVHHWMLILLCFLTCTVMFKYLTLANSFLPVHTGGIWLSVSCRRKFVNIVGVAGGTLFKPMYRQTAGLKKGEYFAQRALHPKITIKRQYLGKSASSKPLERSLSQPLLKVQGGGGRIRPSQHRPDISTQVFRKGFFSFSLVLKGVCHVIFDLQFFMIRTHLGP